MNLDTCLNHASSDAKEESYYEEIINTNNLNRLFLNGYIDSSARDVMSMTARAIETFRKESVGLCGGFGVGFPYHSIDSSGQVISNPEFVRYAADLDNKVYKEMAHSALWPCVSCQSESGFNPSVCVGCEETEIKPRTVMKTMPDIDMFIIVDTADEETRNNLWRKAQESGCMQSDFDVVGAMRRIRHVLTEFSNSACSQEFLPLDLHVISKNDFLRACYDMESGKLDISPEVRSMYAKWKNNKDIDFWFDFVFSMLPYEDGMDNQVLQATRAARKGIASYYSTERIVNITEQKSQRARTLLQHPPMRAILETKVDTWRAIS